MSIHNDPEFKRLENELDNRIAELKEYVEQYAISHDDEMYVPEGMKDSTGSVVSGWVLGVAVTWVDEDGDVCDDMLLYNSPGLNHYQHLGMVAEMHNDLQFPSEEDS